MKTKITLLITLCLAVAPAVLRAEDAQEFAAFFGSLRDDKVNVRAGPGTQYPILWVYKMDGYPVRVIAKYQNWLKVRDVEGEEGWVYRNFVSRRQSAIVQSDSPIALTKDREGRKIIARLENGVIARVDKCEVGQCLLVVSGMKGWADKTRLAMVGK
ncbi:MAG: SH3 domain-containing protein [Proteobacteria bacterium]|nr:SH3 domain-containing protein [Pseudomonadota bacterium]